MFHIDHHANPPTLRFVDDLPHAAPDPELIRRRQLLHDAKTGDPTAASILRNHYHLTYWRCHDREIIANHHPERRSSHAR
jgi:hypothetical protein